MVPLVVAVVLAGPAVSTVPATGSIPVIFDPVGDANLVNWQEPRWAGSSAADPAVLVFGTAGFYGNVQTGPASVAPLDLVRIEFSTAYSTTVVRDGSGAPLFVDHEPTQLVVTIETAAPALPGLGVQTDYDVPVTLNGCYARLRAYVPLILDTILVDTQPHTFLPEFDCMWILGTSGRLEGNGNVMAMSFDAGDGPGDRWPGSLVVGPPPANRITRPFSRTNYDAVGLPGAPAGPVIDDMAPWSGVFVLGQDLPPDVDCTKTPSDPACAG